MGHDPKNKDAVCVLNKVTQTGGVEKVLTSVIQVPVKNIVPGLFSSCGQAMINSSFPVMYGL